MKHCLTLLFCIFYLSIFSQEQNTESARDTVFILFDRKHPDMHYGDSIRHKYPEIYANAPSDSIFILYRYAYRNEIIARFTYNGIPTKELNRREKAFGTDQNHAIVKTVDLSYLSNKTILGFDFFKGKDIDFYEDYFYYKRGYDPNNPVKFVYLIDVDEIENGKIKLRGVGFFSRNL